jgi:alkaline phosphatase D
MKNLLQIILFFGLLICCKHQKVTGFDKRTKNDVVIAFGSCNDQNLVNPLWDDILVHKPSYWIWGGDNIYSDTDDMDLMKSHYDDLLNDTMYQNLRHDLKILGTWDDHDYGLNDGGLEFEVKRESQQLFLNFLNVSHDDIRRSRDGIYHTEMIKTLKGDIKFIILDTRFFRSALSPSKEPNMRYQPNKEGEGTLLGSEQWDWLENELATSNANFNVIVSSIQVVSKEHGYEKWANMPHEIKKLHKIIIKTKPKGIILLSGDRHISEFSKIYLEGLEYPLIDFTSSGLTHSYSNFDKEFNSNRVGHVVSSLSFGLLKFDFDRNMITMQMRGDNDVLQQELIQTY